MRQSQILMGFVTLLGVAICAFPVGAQETSTSLPTDQSRVRSSRLCSRPKGKPLPAAVSLRSINDNDGRMGLETGESGCNLGICCLIDGGTDKTRP